ncbi:DJP1 [Symbiodinium sp. CCMP2456]|nr:DJP1 [Symbiodinium sp. CCMP2456]
MPCVPDTGENCDKKDNAYLEEIKEMAADKMKEEKTRMQKEMEDLEAEYKAASDLFEKQKEEAMATMKKQEDLKKSLSKLKDKTNYKIAILKAKTGDKAGQFPTDVAVYDAEQAARHEALALRLQEQQEREQAEVEMLKAAVGSVFSVRKPRDAVAGTASGLKTMARGVGVGLASLVVQPYVGAKCGGIKGFAKGCGTGLATCVGSTVAGTVVGSGQIVRGVVNTPGAILRTARGEVWNSDARKWEKDWYSLPEEAAEVLCEDCEEAGGESRARSSGSTSRKVQHTELYNVLGVRPEASEADIRRAFYKKSLALHPDKNPDNPEATKQFQEVSDAYRILGDEERRFSLGALVSRCRPGVSVSCSLSFCTPDVRMSRSRRSVQAFSWRRGISMSCTPSGSFRRCISCSCVCSLPSPVKGNFPLVWHCLCAQCMCVWERVLDRA